MSNQKPGSPSPNVLVATSVLPAARVVELADTGGLNPPPCKRVRVRVPPRAPVSNSVDAVTSPASVGRSSVEV